MERPGDGDSKRSPRSLVFKLEGQVLLVAREQLRLVTSLEASSAKNIREDVAITAGKDDKGYNNIADEAAIPKKPRKQEDKENHVEGPPKKQTNVGYREGGPGHGASKG